MINESQKNNPTSWRKWRASGAVSSGNDHLDDCLAVAARSELKGAIIEAGLMRVAAHNDYSNWNAVPKPPLGKMVLLHQTYEGNDGCLYCGKPIDGWKPMEKCPGKYE